MVMERPRTGTQALGRAIDVLECLRSESALGLSEIARRVDLPASTAHRIIHALIDAGYVERDPRTERYRLGMGLVALGRRALDDAGLARAEHVLERLSAATGASASLGVLHGIEVVVVQRVSGPQALRFEHPPGAEIAPHSSAMGKALLAFGATPLHDAVARLGHLERFTEFTIVSPEGLVTALEAIRAQGYATNFEERHVGVNGVAAPVRIGDEPARSAIGVQGPAARIDRRRAVEIAALVKEAADELSDLAPA